MASAIKLSYHKRLFLLLIVFSWTIIFCFIGFQYFREKQYKAEFLNAQLQIYNRHLLTTIKADSSYQDYIETHEKPFDNLRISIITLSGEVIYDSKIELNSLDNHSYRQEIQEALQNGSGYHIQRQSASDGHQYFYSATRGEQLIVRTAIPYSSSLRELLKAGWTFLLVMLTISVLLSILAYFTTRRLGNNIERLNLFAARAEKGESFDEEELFPNDELGSISNHIVQLYAKLQQSIKDRDLAHEASIREKEETLRIKRQLTTNINHELKTPVASIQVCLETLLSGMELSEEKKQELIERCYINNNRLSHLLTDVSLITRMEDGSQFLSKDKVVINDVIKDIKEELELMPEGDRLELHLNFNEEVIILGNQSLISSIFRNLTENAITYSGGQNIYISLLENNEKQCNIRFEDDGRGIDEQHLARLFERFYRVDEGRSRQMGGTGLGLAIVKHAVQFHGGTITVINRPTGGLQFDFTLSKT